MSWKPHEGKTVCIWYSRYRVPGVVTRCDLNGVQVTLLDGNFIPNDVPASSNNYSRSDCVINFTFRKHNDRWVAEGERRYPFLTENAEISETEWY